MDKQALGKAIQKRRMDLGLSQRAVGRLIGASGVAIQNIEAGQCPSTVRANEVLNALKCYMRIGSPTSRTKLDV